LEEAKVEIKAVEDKGLNLDHYNVNDLYNLSYGSNYIDRLIILRPTKIDGL
jgi:hypothetical protein